VKVRGYRIELGEIEAALTEQRGVSESVVVIREDVPGDRRLVAYIVPDAETTLAAGELRSALRARLPEYMLPSAIVPMSELPLTPNGKIDRRALPQPEQGHADHARDGMERQTPTEELMAGIFAEVLGVGEVGVEENFFELGGHSLLATRVVSRVREVFQVEMPLLALFESPTVRELSGYVLEAMQTERRTEQEPLLRVARDENLRLSYAQYRLWFYDQLEPNKSFYNCPLVIQLTGQLDVDALQRTLCEIVRRHEVLRTTFTKVDDLPVQIVAPPLTFELEVEELSGLAQEEQMTEVWRRSAAEAARPFDLSVGPLVRVRLLRLSETEHVMLLTMHHIIIDAWSTGILIEEVGAIYSAYRAGVPSPLAELPVQYADYAAWQHRWLASEAARQQLMYWKRQLGGELPVLNLPTDRPRPVLPTYHGDAYSTTLSPNLLAGLKELSRRQGATLFMTLLASFQTLLFRYTRQEDIIVGTPIANRNRVETEKLIGFFINQLAVRTDLAGNPPFDELLRRVREVTLEAYARQDMPIERIVEELQPERNSSYQPLFNVSFNLINTPKKTLELPGVVLNAMPVSHNAARFDLTLLAEEADGTLRLTWEYKTDIFDAERIKRMHEHYEALLVSIVAEPHARLTTLGMTTEDEKQQLIVEQQKLETVVFKKRKGLRRKITYT
jgi:acyl carrier protein